MPSSWIGTSILTDETEILNDSGVKIHDLLEQNDFGGDGISVSETTHPTLYSKVFNVGDNRLSDVVLSYSVSEDQIGTTTDYSGGIGYLDTYRGTRSVLEYEGKVCLKIEGDGNVYATDNDYVTPLSTMEIYIYWDTLEDGGVLNLGGASSSYSLQVEGGYLYWNYALSQVSGTTGYPLPTEEWLHIVIQKQEGIYRLYVNGTLFTEDSSGDNGSGSEAFALGQGSEATTCYFSDLQITSNGIRYDWGGFTPRVPPYPLVEEGAYLPNMTPPDGTTLSYKIIADAT